MAVTNGSLFASCDRCTAQFVPRRYKQRFCSNRCMYQASNEERAAHKLTLKVGRRCVRCGTEMSPTMRSNAIYCSRTCKSIDYTATHRRGTRPKSKARRQEIIERDGSICYMCHRLLGPKEIQLDHVIAVSRGGSNDPSNFAVSCAPCNKTKGNKITPVQILWLEGRRAA